MSDEPSGEQEWSPQMEWSTPTEDEDTREAMPQKQRFTPRPRVTVLGSAEILSSNSPPAASDGPLAEQAEGLQKQIAEFKEMAQSVQQATREHSAPLGNTLKELAQQVSAIREYAACQQNRVEKLQDGYDWSIVRTFCLRVIRCIDNLENRINRLGEDNEGALQLEEVRDELLFALESSGIEQFRPDVGSMYRGQEKLAEAVKEKEAAAEPSQAGAIAKVVRPGYRYITDEDSFKVVRTAQVKLFG
jgi:molecular chaperone GrpE (heat shock protein)